MSSEQMNVMRLVPLPEFFRKCGVKLPKIKYEALSIFAANGLMLRQSLTFTYKAEFGPIFSLGMLQIAATWTCLELSNSVALCYKAETRLYVANPSETTEARFRATLYCLQPFYFANS